MLKCELWGEIVGAWLLVNVSLCSSSQSLPELMWNRRGKKRVSWMLSLSKRRIIRTWERNGLSHILSLTENKMWGKIFSKVLKYLFECMWMGVGGKISLHLTTKQYLFICLGRKWGKGLLKTSNKVPTLLNKIIFHCTTNEAILWLHF